MQIIRTSAEHASSLGDFPFEIRETDIDAGDGQQLTVRYVDEGPRGAHTIVFLHGNPSWMYIWRTSIAAVVAAGYRAVAIDLVGMGLSDKPSQMTDYTVQRHIDWTADVLFNRLGLAGFTFVLHDWGGIIGMRIAADHPGTVDGMCISNTGLPSRDPSLPLPEDASTPKGPFAGFQKFARETPAWEPWTMLDGLMVTPVRAEVRHGYRAPYPDPSLTIGSRAFTQLLPTRADNPMNTPNWLAWNVLEGYRRPVLTLFSDKDVVAPTGWREIVARIPGAADQPHRILEGGGHFLQEDIPEAFNNALVAWLNHNWSHDS